MLNEGAQSLIGAGGEAVGTLVNGELGFQRLDVCSNLGFLSGGQVTSELVDGKSEQETDDHDDHHDLDEREGARFGEAVGELGSAIHGEEGSRKRRKAVWLAEIFELNFDVAHLGATEISRL